LEGVREAKLEPRILVVGSAQEYGLVKAEELPIREDTPFRPNTPYAVSKIGQDMLAYQYSLAYGLPIVRVRPFNHIGPRQSDAFAASSFARQIAEIELGLKEPILRVGNLEARRDITDVRDIVKGYWLALRNGEPGRVYNLGSQRSYSMEDVLDMLLSQARTEIKVEPDPQRFRPSDTPDLVADCSLAQKELGWSPTIPIEQSLTDLLDFWRARVASTHAGISGA